MKRFRSRSGRDLQGFAALARRKSSRWLLSLVCLFCGLNAPAAQAQAVEDQLRELRLEVQRLRQEIEALRKEVGQSKSPAAGVALSSAGSQAAGLDPQAAQQPSAAAMVELLQAQLAEQAQTKVESSSRLPVKIFGTIVSNTFFNVGEANWLDIPNLVDPAPASLPRESFSSTLRQSRIGAIVEGPTIGSLKASGFIAFDFFGGIPNFPSGQVMGLPRLLYAFARLEGERTAIEVGQDQMIFAPNNPTSLAAMAFPDLFRSGNLYLRVPQVRIERTFAAGSQGEFQLVGGILAPVAGDFLAGSFEFVPPNLAGERSRQPGVQGRLAWRSRAGGGGDGRGVVLGVSGHHGRHRLTTGSRRSWGFAMDFDARAGRFGLGGEWFVGRNLGAFGGALGQQAKSAGGYLEGRVKATERLEFNAGFGTDRLFALGALPAPLDSNSSVFANFIYQLTPELATSLEYRWLSTVPAGGAARRNNHINLVFAYRF